MNTYEPGALARVAGYFEQHPEVQWAYGKCRIVDEHDKEIRRPSPGTRTCCCADTATAKLLAENFISQPATFWRRQLHDEVGYLNEDEHYVMDYEFWLRLGRRYPAGVIPGYLAAFRMYDASKSGKPEQPAIQ